PGKNPSEFSDFMYLLFIVNCFILPGDFDEEKRFNSIHDDYNAEDVIIRCLRYRESLEKEEEKFGLQNLAYILKTKLEIREKKKTD
ncbi:MAG: hypothetical protein GX154_08495, partial [Clostridiales bacterium]|nr:hypothetical protein [Clostridiales bacterium]